MTAPDHMAVPDDRGYDVKGIWLDDVLQPGVVVEYDIPGGWLRRYVMDGSFPRIKDGEFVIEKVHGVVRVEMKG